MSDSPTPAELGYRMPAEWERHAATWIAWPHERDDWPGKFAPVPWVYTEIVRVLTRSDPVVVVVESPREKRRALSLLAAAGVSPPKGRLRFVRARTDRSWLRDTMPSFVTRTLGMPLGDASPLATIAWRFNAWAKYDTYRRDARLPRRVAKNLEIRRFRPRVAAEDKSRRAVLEGGAIDVNGQGTLLTTEECLLSSAQERNPGIGRTDYERLFADYLGVRHVVWLGGGIAGDDTHGHVDDIARFVNPTTIVAAVEPNREDPNHQPLRENLERLRSSQDQDSNALTIVELPMPSPLRFEGERLPASYANFYIANSVVLVPTFNDTNDRLALNTLAALFPDRDVVGIHCVDLVLGLGTLHCLTREQPAVPDAAETS
jgi:agmatine deiminase